MSIPFQDASHEQMAFDSQKELFPHRQAGSAYIASEAEIEEIQIDCNLSSQLFVAIIIRDRN